MTRKERILVVLIAVSITMLVLLGIWSLQLPQIPPQIPPVTVIDPVPENTPEYVPTRIIETTEQEKPLPEHINPLPENVEGGTVKGKVYDIKNEAIHNATVTILQMRKALRYYFTSEEGCYAIGGLPNGVYSVKAEREGYASSTRDNIRVIENEITPNIDFELVKGGIFKGLVVSDSEEPVEGARITLYSSSPASPARGFDRSFHTVANNKGEFVINNIAPGDYMAIAQEEAHIQSERIPLNIEAARPATYKFVLKFGGSVSGVVTDLEGNPVVDAQVWLSSDDNTLILSRGARTDENGNYALKGLKSGKINIQVQSPDYIKAVMKGVEIYEGRPTENLNFTLDSGKTLTGIIVDAAGVPVEKATISGNDKDSYKTVKSDENGKFILKGFSNDAISISVRAQGFVLYVQRDIPANTEDLKIALNRGGTVEGRAVSDEKLGSFVVILYTIAEGGETRRPAKQKISNDPEGFFKVEDIPPGSYSLEIHSKDYIQVKPEAIDVMEDSVISGIQVLMQLRTARR